jgi:hypothetical protein
MKIVKIGLITFAALIICAVALSTFYYNYYSPKKIKIEPDSTAMSYYKKTYDDARALFRFNSDSLIAGFKGAEKSMFKVPSKKDNDLTVDLLYIPAQKTRKRLIIVSSGIHGVEGFVGSAVQAMLMKEFMTDDMLSHTGFLFIHGMNPYGFKYIRRTTENNVDLNRNSSNTADLYQTKNTGYPAVTDLINPEGEAKTRTFSNIFFHLRSIKKIISASMPVLRQAVLQGQYEYPKGVYYGGAKPEPQIVSVAPYIVKYSAGYPLIMNIDLHTGYGENGTAHLFPNPVKNPEIKAMMEKAYDGYRIDWGDSGNFYTVTGDFTGYMGKLVKGTYLPMLIEYGTLDSQTTMGSINSLHRTLLENQGFNNGYASEADRERVVKKFRKMYYPSSPAWKTKVINDTRVMLKKVFQNLKTL